MLIILLADLDPVLAERIEARAGARALVLRAEDHSQAMDLIWSVPVSAIITSLEPLSTERLTQCARYREAAPEAVLVCLASASSRDQVRHEQLPTPDLWIAAEAAPEEIGEIVDATVQTAALKLVSGGLLLGAGGAPRGATEALSGESALFQRLMSGLAAGFDLNRLLHTYVDAVGHYARCATFCLLWRQEGDEAYRVFASQGLPAAMIAQGRLLPSDGLARWYHQSSRVLTRWELADWADRSAAVTIARELEAFRAQVAVPLMTEGRLAGIMLLGDKVIGEPYSVGEIETLFMLSNYVALQVQSFALHAEISRSNNYMERILSGMGSGVITLGREGNVAVCNPYAARVLGLRREEVEGQDLRCLPSPLGDYLYSALRSSDEVVLGLEVSIRGGKETLRVSTSHLADEQGAPLGSVLLLEDMTAQISLATERHRRERLDMLTQVVGGIAHEVKTPLTAIKTYAELTGAGRASSDLQEFWRDTVTPQIDRLDMLIDQLVQLVQQAEPDFELVRLETLVEDALELLRTQDDEQAVFELQVQRPVPRVIADPDHTRQALRYLLRHLRGEGSSPVHIRVGQEEGTGNGDRRVVVTMQRLKRDAKEVQPDEFFDPLRALRETDADLGPAISRTILENQGGTVTASANEGRLEIKVAFPMTTLMASPSAGGEPAEATSRRGEAG
ncbi:MAG TPA: histidine kinase dimerization/phospho-acceptor domain-containing protein [Armatimonadota bacterium]|jgi:signal transduction histidine kinase